MKHVQLTDDLQEQASLFALGALPEPERQEYSRHIEEDRCEVCRAAVDELQDVTTLLAYSVPPAIPSPAIKERLMEQARRAAPPVQRTGFFRRRWLELTTSVAAIAAILVMIVVLRNNAELRRITEELSGQIAQLEAELSDERINVAYLTNPDNRVINLIGQNANAGARARILWNTQSRKWWINVRNLPPISSDQVYQLWFVPKTGAPVSQAVFNTESNGTRQIEIELPDGLTDLKAAAVTTEPAPGLPQPSGQFALLGD